MHAIKCMIAADGVIDSNYGHKKEKYIMRERVDVGERLMNKGIEAS